MDPEYTIDLDGLAWDSAPTFLQSPSTANFTTPPTEPPTSPLIIENRDVDPKKLQVCSSCRRKKRKCSQERPSCSLCRNNGWTCEYRNFRKKPGPAKGTVGLKTPKLDARPTPTPCRLPQTPGYTTPPSLDASIKTSDSAESDKPSSLSETAKFKLIDLYFTYIQPNYPMFRRDSLIRSVEDQAISKKLLYTIFAVSSQFVPESEAWNIFGSACKNPGRKFAELAARPIDNPEDRNAPMSIDDVKAEVLLTLFEFTNFPGRRAWLMVGNLVRLAMGMGLNRLDSGVLDPSLSEQELEEYRFVWWSLWKLDSAINTIASSAFGVENQNIGTALVSTSIADFTAGIYRESAQEFLPTDTLKLWKSAPHLISKDTDDGMSMYLLATSHLRAVSACMQSSYIRPTPELVDQMLVFRNTLQCLRFSLPAWYLEPARQTALESIDKHRLRLETLLILNIGHMRLFLPHSNQKLDALTQDDPKENWKAAVAASENVAAVFHHWAPTYFPLANLMISVIIWTAHFLLVLHTMCRSDETPDVRITNAIDFLNLALQNFAQYWRFARTLLDSANNLQGWSWLRIDFAEAQSILEHLRFPIDPGSKSPGSLDMWEILKRMATEVTGIDEFLQSNSLALQV